MDISIEPCSSDKKISIVRYSGLAPTTSSLSITIDFDIVFTVMSIDQPHNGIVRLVFGEPKNAAALIQANLPAKLIALLDWSTLYIEPASFIRSNFDQRHSDLFCSIQTYSGQPVCIYVLFEHQSDNDIIMPLRMLDACVQFWLTQVRHGRVNAGQLPLIIPLVLSHAVEGWKAATHFRQLFDATELDALETALGSRLVSDFSFILDDLTTRSDDEIRARGATVDGMLACWALRDARHTERFSAALQHWAALFESVLSLPSGQERLSILIRYLLAVCDVQWEQIYDTIIAQAPSTKDTVMTLAQRLLEEGKVQGRVEGRVEALRETLRLQSIDRFGSLPEWLDARISTASTEQLRAWLKAILHAQSLEEVLDPRH